MRENRDNKSYIAMGWPGQLIPYEFAIEHLPGSKIVLVDRMLLEPQEEATKISTYDEQIIDVKLVGNQTKRKNPKNTELAERHEAFYLKTNTLNTGDKIFSEIRLRNRRILKAVIMTE